MPEHIKPIARPALPPDMPLHPEFNQATLLDMVTARSESEKREFLINLIRIGTENADPPTWAAVHTLISSTTVPGMRVGFLPVIPRPITERATVRHCLTVFQSVRRQLNQSSLPIWCDENVFAQAADIYLHETEEFKDLVLCMGPFHWTRVLLRCQGKLIKGSGVDDGLIETSVFGPGVIESVLNGHHYVRALAGMLIVEDVIRSRQWEIFCSQKNKDDYPVLAEIRSLQTMLSKNHHCSNQFQAIIDQVEVLGKDFREFEKECEAKSQLCQFFGVWLQLVVVIKNAVVSEREGNWNLHVATVEDCMPLFAEFDCINYLRHGSWYLEQMKVLEFTHPELYRRFSLGQWVVQDRPGSFCAVGGDMKVEQTIQRVSKGPGGHYTVGASRNAKAVAEFELLFHEIGSITNVLNILTSNESMKHTECQLQHALSATRRLNVNQNVTKLFDFVKQHRNPYLIMVSVPVPLHHLLTKQAVDPSVVSRFLECVNNGKKVYQSFRRERMVEKTKKLSSTITKGKFPAFNAHKEKTPTLVLKGKQELSTKSMASAHRNIDIAKDRGMTLPEILSHDLLPVSPLFEGDLPASASKSKLIEWIEQYLDLDTWSHDTNLATHVVMDFMSRIRQMPLAHFASLGAVINAIINSASSLSQKLESIHMILDSYIERSLKEGERLRRTHDIKGIDIIGMTKETPIPQQLDKFWVYECNKRNIQALCRDMACSRTKSNPNIIVSSVVHEDEVLPAETSEGRDIPELINWIEEADDRLIVHVEWAIRVKKCKRIIVVSNDTDPFGRLLYYTPHFMTIGAKEIWQQYGTGERRRMLPLHQAVCRLGTQLAKTVVKAHILSGEDCMSKIGTKNAAMASDPVQYLTNFGETDVLSEQDIAQAEKYLVRVWAGTRSNTTADTFDQLRLENYTGGSVGIYCLPPTSSVIKGHIHRAFLLIHRACHILENGADYDAGLDPIEHGW